MRAILASLSLVTSRAGLRMSFEPFDAQLASHRR